MENSARGGKDCLRPAGSANKDGEAPRSLWPLAIVDIDGGTRSDFQTVVANVTNHANYREQARVAVHISEFDSAADGILVWPFFFCEGLANEGDMRRVYGVAVIKEAALKERNAETLEKTFSGHAIVCIAHVRLISEKTLKELREFGEQRRVFFQVACQRALNQ